jgi:hypothetical protein
VKSTVCDMSGVRTRLGGFIRAWWHLNMSAKHVSPLTRCDGKYRTRQSRVHAAISRAGVVASFLLARFSQGIKIAAPCLHELCFEGQQHGGRNPISPSVQGILSGPLEE